jgi:hypothetical protein
MHRETTTRGSSPGRGPSEQAGGCHHGPAISSGARLQDRNVGRAAGKAVGRWRWCCRREGGRAAAARRAGLEFVEQLLTTNLTSTAKTERNVGMLLACSSASRSIASLVSWPLALAPRPPVVVVVLVHRRLGRARRHDLDRLPGATGIRARSSWRMARSRPSQLATCIQLRV